MKNCHVCEINPHPQEAIIQPTSSNIEPHPTPHICPFRSFTRGASPKSPKPGPWPAALRGSPEVSICVDVVTNTHLRPFRPFRPFRRPIPANSCGPRYTLLEASNKTAVGSWTLDPKERKWCHVLIIFETSWDRLIDEVGSVFNLLKSHDRHDLTHVSQRVAKWQIFGSKIDILRIKCSARP